MFSQTGRRVTTILFTVALAPLFSVGPAPAQFRGRFQQRQAPLQQANGTQQTTCPTTTALQQTTSSQNTNTLQTALQQLQTALQTALQQTNSLLTTLQQQNGQLTSSQLQTLRQQLGALSRQLRAVQSGSRR
jgi:hypothetical protein